MGASDSYVLLFVIKCKFNKMKVSAPELMLTLGIGFGSPNQNLVSVADYYYRSTRVKIDNCSNADVAPKTGFSEIGPPPSSFSVLLPSYVFVFGLS